MALDIPLKNSLLMNGNEQDLFTPQTGLKQYETKINFDALQPADEIVIRVYLQDEQVGSRKRYLTVPIRGTRINPVEVINWLATSSYRVSCQQIAGTNRTITWALFTV